jgi:hypothetical protein
MKKLKFSLTEKKYLKFFVYLFSLFIFFSIIYISTPKLLNFSPESVKESLKNNNNIKIRNISRIDYKIFPTPRLILPNSSFVFGEDIFEVNNSELEIILNISEILNFKTVDYKKLLINQGSLEININNISKLLKNINKNKKKLTFKKNNIIFLYKETFFFEISDASINLKPLSEKKKLIINGNFLNNKIFIKLESKLKNKNNLILKIPELDIETKVSFVKNNLGNINGFFNLKIFNNLVKFNFTKEDNLKLINGYIRSKLINSFFEGNIEFEPNFFSTLNLKISDLNIKKLIPLMQKNYFSNNISNLALIKKINGVYKFKSKFEGKIIIKNGEILFEEFNVGKNKSFLFNVKINTFGKKGKIQFNLIKIIKHKRDLTKKIEIKGVLIPSNSKIIFENFFLDDKKLSVEKTKELENKFKDEIIQNTLVNIFNESKMNRYFRNLF